MKKILSICLLVISTPSIVSASPDFFCSLKHAKRVITIAKDHSTYDKNRHCSVSCMLALKCNDEEVLMVGLLKEIKDLFGPGEASEDDFKADVLGVSLASKHAAKEDSECLAQCDLYFQPYASSPLKQVLLRAF